MAYAPNPKPGNDYYVDRDTRPKQFPCQHCARDVESGRRCICVPSMPLTFIPTGEFVPVPFIVR